MSKKNILTKKRIPLPLYKKIVASVPICCVDALLKSGNEIYLFKRAREPAKNQWWVVGGRIFRGETFEKAILRKAKEEIGVDVKISKMIGVYEEFFDTGYFESANLEEKSGTHTISICFVIEPKNNNFKLKLNDEYSSYKVVKKIERGLHPYIKRLLKDSGLMQ